MTINASRVDLDSLPFFCNSRRDDLTGDVYSRSEAGQAQDVNFGKITSIAVTREANPREPFAQGERVRVLANGGRPRITH